MNKKKLQNKIDNLHEQQLYKLAKEESKKKLKKSITKIVSSKIKAYESFNVDIINN